MSQEQEKCSGWAEKSKSSSLNIKHPSAVGYGIRLKKKFFFKQDEKIWNLTRWTPYFSKHYGFWVEYGLDFRTAN